MCPGPSPWLIDGLLLPVSLYINLPSMSVCVQTSPSYKDTSWIGLGPTLMIPPLNLIIFPNKVTFEDTGG